MSATRAVARGPAPGPARPTGAHRRSVPAEAARFMRRSSHAGRRRPSGFAHEPGVTSPASPAQRPRRLVEREARQPRERQRPPDRHQREAGAARLRAQRRDRRHAGRVDQREQHERDRLHAVDVRRRARSPAPALRGRRSPPARRSGFPWRRSRRSARWSAASSMPIGASTGSAKRPIMPAKRVRAAGRDAGRQVRQQPHQHHAGDDEARRAPQEVAHLVPGAQRDLAQRGQPVGRQLQHERLVVAVAAAEHERGQDRRGEAREIEPEQHPRAPAPARTARRRGRGTPAAAPSTARTA